MQAGLLDKTITILYKREVQNKYGEQTVTYGQTEADQYKTRARVIQVSGNRTDQNNETFYTYIKRFEVRRYVPINEYDYILYNGKKYRILNIDDSNTSLQNKVIDTELVNE